MILYTIIITYEENVIINEETNLKQSSLHLISLCDP